MGERRLIPPPCDAKRSKAPEDWRTPQPGGWRTAVGIREAFRSAAVLWCFRFRGAPCRGSVEMVSSWAAAPPGLRSGAGEIGGFLFAGAFDVGEQVEDFLFGQLVYRAVGQ